MNDEFMTHLSVYHEETEEGIPVVSAGVYTKPNAAGEVEFYLDVLMQNFGNTPEGIAAAAEVLSNAGRMMQEELAETETEDIEFSDESFTLEDLTDLLGGLFNG